jgi:hypothetical protein
VESSVEAVVSLPGGLLLEDGRLLRRAVLRSPTGREEEWLADHAGPIPPAVTTLIAACVAELEGLTVDRTVARGLLVGDRDFLVLQLRTLSLGDAVQAVASCPACHEKLDIDFNIADIPIKERPGTAHTYSVDLAGRGRARRRVRFRLPTGADQEALGEPDATDPVEVLLRRCLMDDDASRLSATDRVAVIDEIEARSPEIDLELDLVCPACEASFVLPFDTTSFFLSELRRNGRRLLEQVHVLALHYHWTESDILDLTSARRRRYLALLGESLSPVQA